MNQPASPTPDPRQLLPDSAVALCEGVVRALPVQRSAVWWLRAQGLAGRLLGFDRADGVLAATAEPVDWGGLVADLRARRCVVVEDARGDPRCATLAGTPGSEAAALMLAPLLVRGEVAGFLSAEHAGGLRSWHARDRELLLGLAQLLSTAFPAQLRGGREDELELQNIALERQVDERTRALQEALDRLESTRNQLIDCEKLAALGSLVASIAHEVNSPIGVALTATTHGSETLNTLLRRVGEGALTRSALDGGLADLGEALSLATRNIDRAARLIASFKQTAADRTSQKRASFELGAYVEAVVATLGPMLRKRGVAIEVSTEGYVTLDSFPGAVAHVVSNLVGNAVTHGFAQSQDDPRIRISILSGGEAVELVVEDNGRGMDAETLSHAFEPFYTTARGRGGTGLGLSIVQSMVVETLGGSLQLDSEPGAGTRVRLQLPRLAPPRPDEGVAMPVA